MPKRKKHITLFMAVTICLVCAAVIAAVFLLRRTGADPIFRYVFPPSVGGLLIWGVVLIFYRFGFYTGSQAREFYGLCQKDGIKKVDNNTKVLCREHYKAAVSEYAALSEKNELEIMREAFSEGRDLTNKNTKG